ncbi:hypothetical protein B0H13DRAFT_2302667 [Mycena leptocephala]|nr:hypothetical protein B0H13DRAFT_2302667 [Mycena leptocephala]
MHSLCLPSLVPRPTLHPPSMHSLFFLARCITTFIQSLGSLLPSRSSLYNASPLLSPRTQYAANPLRRRIGGTRIASIGWVYAATRRSPLAPPSSGNAGGTPTRSPHSPSHRSHRSPSQPVTPSNRPRDSSSPYNSARSNRHAPRLSFRGTEDFTQVGVLAARKLKLKPDTVIRLEDFAKAIFSLLTAQSVSEVSMFAQLLKISEMLAYPNAGNAIVSVPKKLDHKIDIHSIRTMLSPTLAFYVKKSGPDTPSGIMKALVLQHADSWGLTPEMIDDKAQWGVVAARIRTRLTDRRYDIKKIVISKTEDGQVVVTIIQLCEALVDIVPDAHVTSASVLFAHHYPLPFPLPLRPSPSLPAPHVATARPWLEAYPNPFSFLALALPTAFPCRRTIPSPALSVTPPPSSALHLHRISAPLPAVRFNCKPVSARQDLVHKFQSQALPLVNLLMLNCNPTILSNPAPLKHVVQDVQDSPSNTIQSHRLFTGPDAGMRVTLAMLGRVALLRQVLIDVKGGQKFWEKVDEQLAMLREKYDNNEAAISKAIAKVLKHDRRAYGNPDLSIFT